ncbi:hypothetical protein [Rufibacter hautae]|uniref:Uncharacterized protein n=1 Tax=Rufibacter hautae TaxID=2595005 RepID=A0A5B6T9Z0_9BACT|nr:hypothetical protein [Rufibacter hautae]KAA3436755.1 hypothetical protein FOA19_20470 [Rufibacter hautae]
MVVKLHIIFFDSSFEDLIIENQENIEFEEVSFHFFGCVINEINISRIQSKNISIHFASSILSGKINANHLKGVSFNNCLLKDSIFLINQNNIDISYTEENIFPLVWKKVLRKLRVKSFLEAVPESQRYYIDSAKKISYRTNEVKRDKDGVYYDKYQRNSYYKIGYYLNPDERELLNISLSIDYTQENEDVLTKINNSYLNSLSFSGYSGGKVYVENCKVENLYIREYSSKGETTFFNVGPLGLVEKENKIEIYKSNLDNTWFDDIDFTKFKIVSFYRTKFGKAVFTSCAFPNDYTSFDKFKSLENVHYPDKKSDSYYKNQYEIFLQLKSMLESTGNFYESQKMQAISNEALKQIKHISSWDKLILWINGKSNNHGLSIKLPLMYFFSFSIILYIIYLMSLGRMFNKNDVDLNLVGYYFSFIDITHRVDFLANKEEFNPISLCVDFFNKIISGFFIFQFVSAFRKYGKK